MDSIGESLAAEGFKPNDDDDVTRWFRLLPRRLARNGAAVMGVDHVTKSAEGRGLYAIGSQRKLAAIDGAAYLVDVVSAPTKEQLERGTRVIADAATEAGIDRLHWLDTYQAGAAACTWPLARGMAAIAPPLGASLLSLAAGSSTKEPAA